MGGAVLLYWIRTDAQAVSSGIEGTVIVYRLAGDGWWSSQDGLYRPKTGTNLTHGYLEANACNGPKSQLGHA